MAFRYFSCSRLVESAWEGPGKRREERISGEGRALGGHEKTCPGGTCGGSILGLEETHHALPVQAPRPQQQGFGARVPPADHREAVLPVAARDPLNRVVLDALRDDQQSWVTAKAKQTL